MYLHLALATAAAIFLVFRLYNMGLFEFAVSDVGCKNPDIDGNPFERYERYGEKQITDASHCVFNAFDTTLITHSDTVLDSNSAIQKLDWSNPDTFKQSQRDVVVAAANSVGGSYTNETLPYYYESYYWGCSSVCTSDRYDANMMFLYLTVISLLFHIAAIPLNLAIANSKMPLNHKMETTNRCYNKKMLKHQMLKKIKPKKPTVQRILLLTPNQTS